MAVAFLKGGSWVGGVGGFFFWGFVQVAGGVE